jgi:sugar-specific transcriptional regulator TrmB
MKEIFEKLGLENEETIVLESLIKNGTQTVLQVSRSTSIKRTNVYRIIENLEESGYIYKVLTENTSKYAPLSLQFLNKKIEEKEKEVLSLKEDFRSNQKSLESYYSQNINHIGANYYNGSNEVKQLLWNSLSAKNGIKSFGYRSLRNAVGEKFLSEWWNETVRRDVPSKMIANEETYVEKSHKTNNAAFLTEPYIKFFDKRILPLTQIAITTETFIYNDVYSIIQWNENEVYGIEILNDVIRKQEEQVFDFLWNQAKIYKK